MIDFYEKMPDIEDYFQLFLTTGWNDEYDFSKSEIKTAIENSWYMISAYDKLKLVGFGRVIADGIHHALIVDLIVHPNYQNNRIGTQILNTILIKCKNHKIRDIQLFSAKDKFKFYEKFGFITRQQNAPGMQYLYDNQ